MKERPACHDSGVNKSVSTRQGGRDHDDRSFIRAMQPRTDFAALDFAGRESRGNVQTSTEVGASFDRIERTVLTGVLQIGRQALQLFVSLQGEGELGEGIQTENGQTARRSTRNLPTFDLVRTR